MTDDSPENCTIPEVAPFVISTDRREWRNLPVEHYRSLGFGLRPPLGMTIMGICG